MLSWIIRLAVGLIAFVALILALFVGLPWATVLGERIGAGPFKAHLAANEAVLDLAAPDAGFRLPDESLAARYVLLGEMHGYVTPQRLDIALVNYLQAEGPPRWYLAEMTPREAIAVNEYISGGSDEYLRAVFDRFASMRVQWGNKEFFEKLTSLRAMNETLPGPRQVRFIGIDLDRDGEPLALPMRADAALPDLADPKTARAINEALIAVVPESAGRYGAMKARLEALSTMQGFADARFMGLWGLFHASEAPINKAEPLARWLQDEAAPYAGDVLTINTLCVGKCFNMMPATALPASLAGPEGEAYTWLPMGVENPYFQRPKGISDLIATLGDDAAALYRISGEQSPYNAGDRLTATSGYLSMLQPWKVSGSASEMTDYMIVYRNSDPLHPWSGEAYDITGEVSAMN